MKSKVILLDYGLGNLFSLKQALIYLGHDVIITNDKDEIMKSNSLILPGVGSFGTAMKNLEELNLISTLHEYISTGKDFIGICLGMQLMFNSSSEFGIHSGLNIISGDVMKFSFNKNYYTPQIQWNRIEKSPFYNTFDMNLFNNGDFMFFVHSYYCVPKNPENVIATTNYNGINYPSIIKKDNCLGIQFHPEKSGQKGLKLLNNVLKLNYGK